MKFSMIIFTLLSLALSCNVHCRLLCESLNGFKSCYESCGCAAEFNSPVSLALKTEYYQLIQTLTKCQITKAEYCPYGNSYTACLSQLNCQILVDGFALQAQIPPHLLKAVQPVALNPSYLSYESLECSECAYYYYANDYYECAYWNCREQMMKKAEFLRQGRSSSKEAGLCKDCGGYAIDNDFVNCVWFYCKDEIVDKVVLLKEMPMPIILVENTTSCSDCEDFVFADDYYDCVITYCDEEVLSKDVLFASSQLNNPQDTCDLCANLNSEGFTSCAYFQCRERILKLASDIIPSEKGSAILKLTSCDDCKFYTGEDYDTCEYYYCNGRQPTIKMHLTLPSIQIVSGAASPRYTEENLQLAEMTNNIYIIDQHNHYQNGFSFLILVGVILLICAVGLLFYKNSINQVKVLSDTNESHVSYHIIV